MRAAEGDWLNWQPGAQKKQARAFWPIKLVRGKTSRINQTEIGRLFAERLHHVAVQQHAALATNLRDLCHRLRYASLVVSRHDRNQSRIRSERVRQFFRIDAATIVDPQEGDLETLALLQMLECIQDRVMFRAATDQVSTLILPTARPRPRTRQDYWILCRSR